MKIRPFLVYALVVPTLGSLRLLGASGAFMDYPGTTAGLAATIVNQTTGFNAAVDSSNSGDWRLTFNGVAFDQAQGVLIPQAYPTFGADHINSTVTAGRGFLEVPGRYTEFNAVSGFANGWISLTDITGSGSEANFDMGFVYFPFSEGWISGSISSTGFLNAGNTPGVFLTDDADDPGRFTVSISGVDSRTSGMLFVVGGDNANSGNVVGTEVKADGSGWEICSFDQGGDFLDTGDGDTENDGGQEGTFHFVYVPYDTPNLIGGRIDDDGSVLNTTGGFTSTRLGIGTYFIQISDGLGGFLDPSDGLMITTGSKAATKGAAIDPDDNFQEVLYNSTTQGWEVRSFDLPSAPLQDTEFVFAFVSYSAPLLPVPEPSSALILSLGSALLLARRRRSAN
jgi:hypothetical protein